MRGQPGSPSARLRRPGNQVWEASPPQEQLGAPWGFGARWPPPPLCSTGPPARPCASPRHLPGCPGTPDHAAGTPSVASPSARMGRSLPAGPGQTPPKLGIQDTRAREGVAFIRPQHWEFRTACAREGVASTLPFLLFSVPPVKSPQRSSGFRSHKRRKAENNSL